MILSFACKETETIWEGRRSRKLPEMIQERALRKLRQLDAARSLEELRVPPSNHLEVLRGDRKGSMSIRVNGQWRLCFEWNGTDALMVKIIDYH